MEHKVEKDKCKAEIQVLRDYREAIPDVVEKLVGTCNRGDSFDHVSSEPTPSKDAMIEIVHQCQRILFPDILCQQDLTGSICITIWARKQYPFLKNFRAK